MCEVTPICMSLVSRCISDFASKIRSIKSDCLRMAKYGSHIREAPGLRTQHRRDRS